MMLLHVLQMPKVNTIHRHILRHAYGKKYTHYHIRTSIAVNVDYNNSSSTMYID